MDIYCNLLYFSLFCMEYFKTKETSNYNRYTDDYNFPFHVRSFFDTRLCVIFHYIFYFAYFHGILVGDFYVSNNKTAPLHSKIELTLFKRSNSVSDSFNFRALSARHTCWEWLKGFCLFRYVYLFLFTFPIKWLALLFINWIVHLDPL